MQDKSCVAFLQWALPQLQMRWPGFRKVRGQVCKRIARRIAELQLADLESYQAYLCNHPQEWPILDSLCRITISRFYRDRGIFDFLGSLVLPGLIEAARTQGEKYISCWCIGSASGEEPYSLSLLWDHSMLENPGLDLHILATEIDLFMIKRAGRGCYPESSMRELPPEIKNRAFTRRKELFCLKEQHKNRVQFQQQDIRSTQPDATFHLIFCRNLVFTYFSAELQRKVALNIIKCLKPGGFLVLGSHEKLPETLSSMSGFKGMPIYRNAEGP